MAKDDKEFGPFGKIEPIGKRWFPHFGLVHYIVFIIIIGILPFSLGGLQDFYRSFVERIPPLIKVEQHPSGIGLNPITLRFKVKDADSGLDVVIVRSEQGNEIRNHFEKNYKNFVREDEISLAIDGKEIGFEQGTVEFTILAWDRSFLSNRAQTRIRFIVDFERPEIEVLTSQHNMVRGGVGLIFFRVGAGEHDVQAGTAVGAELFAGFPADKLDEGYKAFRDVYFSFFAIPLGYQEDTEKVRIFARDPVGNETSSSFYYRVRERSAGSTTVELSEKFLSSVVDRVYQESVELKNTLQPLAKVEFVPAVSDQERIDRFVELNTSFRDLVNEALSPIFFRPKFERFWKGVFLRPYGRRLSYDFGEKVLYQYGGETIAEQVLGGQYFVGKVGTPVRAANDGVIIFADDLGPYGKTIVIDHGFGLTTLYAHLESFQFSEGARVTKGQHIALMGSSGLVPERRLLFEFRMHGVPVRPAEWWDENWIADHIEAKIGETKAKLGLSVQSPLE